MPTRYSALLTDLYQLTMACAYWKAGKHEHEAVFHLYFRQPPFGGHYALVCGLQQVIRFLKYFGFEEDELSYLASVRGANGHPLFPGPFLDYLRTMRSSVTLHAVPEGTAVLAGTPLIRVRGPIIQCQIIETALLTLMNYQTLIATKAGRVCDAAEGDLVLEFGLRRAQGPDGGLSASRAAYIGGCAGTSNLEAGKVWGIPVKGTHAHSWVMSFEEEEEAFHAYAEAMPDNVTLLVDTYDTVEGIRRAIRIGHWLRQRGFDLVGIRLDSGDLANLSKTARSMLNEAGLHQTAIVASNDLDEYEIRKLKAQGAPIAVWGVGTRLVTGYGQPSLGGVYKLAAYREPGREWQHKMKVSEEPDKSTVPGILQVQRVEEQGVWKQDVILDELQEDGGESVLLQEIFAQGNLVYLQRDIHHIREYAMEQRRWANRSFRQGHPDLIFSEQLKRKIDQMRTAMQEE